MVQVPSEWLLLGLYALVAGSLATYSAYRVYEDAKHRGSPHPDSWAAIVGIAFLVGIVPGFVLYSAYFFTRGALESATPTHQ